MTAVSSLKDQCLVAMPGMQDERFIKTVIYLVGHGEDGAMGLVINQSLEDIQFSEVLEDMKLGSSEDLICLPSVRDRQVLRGGPVDTSRGFVLHTTDYQGAGDTYDVSDQICLTATTEALKAISIGPGPEKSLFALGYCGWGPGQLENELKDNGWLTVPSSSGLLFDAPLDDRYDKALAQLGISPAQLSSEAGHA